MVDKTLIYSFQDVHVRFECYFNVGNYYYPVQRIDTIYRLDDAKKVTIGMRPSGRDLYFSILLCIPLLRQSISFN
jgi:hypothetical protein